MDNLTIEEYHDVIQNALSDRQIETLKLLYYFPNSSATAKELAAALNYSSYQAANRQVGQIGKTISKYIGFVPRLYESSRGMQPAYWTIVGEYKDTGWEMWNELQEALESLDLVSKDNELEPFERLSTEIFSFNEKKFYREGKIVEVFVNKFERSLKARLECIKHHGTKCYVCKFDFGQTYGDMAQGFIHVHHKISLAEIGDEYEVDPINDLIPLCPNCHAVVHLTRPTMAIEELIKIFK